MNRANNRIQIFSIFLARISTTRCRHDARLAPAPSQVVNVTSSRMPARLSFTYIFAFLLGYCSEGADRDRSMSGDSTALRGGSRRVLQQQSTEDGLTWIPETSIPPSNLSEISVLPKNRVEIEIHRETPGTPPADFMMNISASTTIITTSSSVDTLTGESNTISLLSGPSSPSNLSSVTLVGSTGSGSGNHNERDKDLTPTQEGIRLFKYGRAPTSPLPERKRKPADAGGGKDDALKHSSALSTPRSSLTSTAEEVKLTRIETTINTKPTIVSTIAKSPIASGTSLILGRSRSASPSKATTGTSGGLTPNMSYLTMNRRPSAGANVIPVAALCQHRHSLQLNASDIGMGQPSIDRNSPRGSRRTSKSTEKSTRKSIFGTPQKEAPR